MKSILKIKFLRNILILSSLIAVGLPLFVILLIYPLFYGALTKNTENMVIRIAKHLSSEVIGNQDMLSRNFLTGETFSVIQADVANFGLMKLKIFSASGEIIFSTDPKDIGDINKESYFHDFVSKGDVYSKVVKKGAKSLEDQIVSADVVETYISIIKNDKFVGAFEIYYNITDDKARLDKLIHTSSLVIILMATCLQGTIIISLFKASKSMTEREKAESLLIKSEEKYKILSENSQIGIYIQQEDKIVYANNRFAELHGYTVQELLYTNCFELFHPSEKTHIQEIKPNLLRGPGAYQSFEALKVKKDGGSLWCQTVAVNIEYQGKTAIMGNSVDISDRKQAEEQRDRFILKLQDANARLETLSAISQTVNKTLDPDQILNDALDVIMEKFKPHSAHIRLFENETQEMVLVAHKGYTQEDLKKLQTRKKIEKTVSSFAVDSHEAVAIEDILTDSRAEGKDSLTKIIGCRSLVTLVLYAKDKIVGNLAIRFLKTRAYNDEEIQFFNSLGHLIGTAIENSRLYKEREITIKELSEAQGRLQQAHKMEAIGTLAGGIAHDFNNILSAIFGYTELAQMKLAPDSAIKNDLEEVLNAGGRAKDLIKQILAFSHQTKEEQKPVQMSLIVNEALKLLRSTLPTSIDIQQHIRTQSLVLSDPTKLHQILMNLCTNAAHAMRGKGGILAVTLSDIELGSDIASTLPDIQPGAYLVLRVSDTGHGITPEVMSRIFDPFFTTKDKDEGTGLGLSVVHGIVKGCGGTITVYSEPDRGATFNLYFPIIKRSLEEKPKEYTITPGGTERILFVDDEKSIIDIIQKALTSLGYVVKARNSSIEALALFKAMPDKFDLVITDMTMPQMTGDMLARELMKIRSDIPVIVCTGFSDNITKEKAATMGIKAFLMKPLLTEEMARTIRRVLDL